MDVNGINKLAGEWYHLLYNNIYDISACALRLTNTYGPGMRVNGARYTFLGIWLRNILEGKPILAFGVTANRLCDFNYVDDMLSMPCCWRRSVRMLMARFITLAVMQAISSAGRTRFPELLPDAEESPDSAVSARA